MSDYLLLLNKKQCPACRREHNVSNFPSRCRHCGMWLFDASNQMKKFEEQTGWREYWVWCGEHGYKHRSHLFTTDGKEVQDESALKRVYHSPKLDDDYGTPDYLGRKMAQATNRTVFHRHD